MNKFPAEKLGMSIRGGVDSVRGNPHDDTDKGIFVSKARLGLVFSAFSFIPPLALISTLLLTLVITHLYASHTGEAGIVLVSSTHLCACVSLSGQTKAVKLLIGNSLVSINWN